MLIPDFEEFYKGSTNDSELHYHGHLYFTMNAVIICKKTAKNVKQADNVITR